MRFPVVDYSHRPGIRLRALPEMGQCLAYDPAGPRLYTLNTTTWLVLVLCDGASRATVVAGFHKEVEPLLTLAEVALYADEALADLLAKCLIEATPTPTQASAPASAATRGEQHA